MLRPHFSFYVFLSTMFTHSPGVFTEGSSSPESFFLPPRVDKHSPEALSASPRLWRSPQASCPPGLPLRPPQAPHRPRLFYFPRAFFMAVCFGRTPCSCPTAAKFLLRPKAFLSHPSQRCVSVRPDPSAFTLSPHQLGPSFETPQSPLLAPNTAWPPKWPRGGQTPGWLWCRSKPRGDGSALGPGVR